MATGYVRQSAADIQAGLQITAADHNNEYNQIQSAFDNSTGHDHSGSVDGVGAPINLTNAVTGILPTANGGTGNTNGKLLTNVRIITTTGSLTVSSTDGLIVWNPVTPATSVLTLPASPNIGDTYEIKYLADPTVLILPLVITPQGGQTIDGASSYIMQIPYQCITIVYIGSSNWILK